MSKWKKAWIWFWYNDITRICLIIIPLYNIALIPLLYFLGIRDPELMKVIMVGIWGILFTWGMIDNDYSNLRKIGLDEYRNPLPKKEKPNGK